MDAACLLLHGFGGTPFEMEPLEAPLREVGFTVRNLCLPGHGSTVEEFQRTGFDDWRAASEQAYRELAAEHKRVLAVGLSMGGTLALSLAARFPLAGAATLATPVFVFRLIPWQVRDWRLLALSLFAKYRPTLPGKITKPESRAIAPWRGYEGVLCPPQLLSLKRGTDATRHELPKITAPLLIMHDRRDRLTYPDNAWEIARGVSSRHVTVQLTAIEENVTSRHLLTTHRETKELVAAAVTRFALEAAEGRLG